MIRLIIIRFWWVFIPLFIYLLVVLYSKSKRKRIGEVAKPLISSAFLWVIISTIIIAIISFIGLGLSYEPNEGLYIPDSYNEGKLISGSVK